MTVPWTGLTPEAIEVLRALHDPAVGARRAKARADRQWQCVPWLIAAVTGLLWRAAFAGPWQAVIDAVCVALIVGLVAFGRNYQRSK